MPGGMDTIGIDWAVAKEKNFESANDELLGKAA